ncbi:hypothetical protein GJ699_07485 [Duganella sp. FT80W]|uniref:Uncharacterized protein n=1 Tax=Duganella guangzhouensis TaxID=2666084 RepID=A0A6I2KVS4_9BURK|nr:hypothetical protein [Duganella guangzhouensis]MRW89821.1 hypothetical protein [Duganella guangzhouensis]
MDLVLSGIGLLLILPVWRYIVKRSLLDTHRDKLFDLRDELRDKFHASGWDMGGPVYKQLRDLLNGYLRYTESFQFIEFIVIETGIQRNPELQAEMKARFEKVFAGMDEEQRHFAIGLRKEARRVMMSHMILSSFPLALITAVLFPFVALYMVLRASMESISSTGLSFSRSARELRELVAAFAKLVVARIAKAFLVEDLVEEYSYRQAHLASNNSSRQS